jgi:outer membrane lipoprotein SlyB
MRVWRAVMCAGLMAALGSCAGAPPRLPPQAPAAVPMGQMTLGRIVAIRDVSVTGEAGGEGLNAVLAALNEGSMAGPVSGEEVVIRQDDGNTVVVSQSAAGFAVGDEVGIIASDQTTLIHR